MKKESRSAAMMERESSFSSHRPIRRMSITEISIDEDIVASADRNAGLKHQLSIEILKSILADYDEDGEEPKGQLAGNSADVTLLTLPQRSWESCHPSGELLDQALQHVPKLPQTADMLDGAQSRETSGLARGRPCWPKGTVLRRSPTLRHRSISSPSVCLANLFFATSCGSSVKLWSIVFRW